MSETTSPRRWWALAVIAAAQFMVIMDTSIVGVALPKMQSELGFDPGNLSWVFNAYVVAFGGLLLLGGRLSDLLGARRVFAAGWGVLLVGSLVAGLATGVGAELAGRAVQGIGAALIAPSALTLLMMLFGANPRELTKAISAVDDARAEYTNNLPRISAESDGGGSDRVAADLGYQVDYGAGAEKDFMYWLKAGFAFTLPLLALGIIFVVVVIGALGNAAK